MPATVAEPRPSSPRRDEHHFRLKSEPLEPRRLLATIQTVVAPELTAVSGLPVIGLETGFGQTAVTVPSIDVGAPTFQPGLPAAGQLQSEDEVAYGFTLEQPALQPSVSLPPITSAFQLPGGLNANLLATGPTAVGPSTTLNPLGYLTETANAPASEVAQAKPGFLDRVSSSIPTPPIILLPHFFRAPSSRDVPGPRVPPNPPAKAPAPPVRPPLENAEPERAAPKAAQPEATRPGDVAPSPLPKEAPAEARPSPTEPKQPVSLQAWDAAIELVETDLSDGVPASLSIHMEESLATGALLAAWAGWNHGSRLEGRSRQRPLSPSIPSLEAGPGDGSGR